MKKIKFLSEAFEIEGIIEGTDNGNKGVVITHPHPLYGGDMKNDVVELIAGIYVQKGYTALRFNFRGAGNSHGKYDNGKGEQNDLLAAISYLKNFGIDSIDIAGYSYGTWVNVLTYNNYDIELNEMVMVSPPLSFIDFEPLNTLKELKLVICGDRDDFAPINKLKQSVSKWNNNAYLKIINGADHFYSGYLNKLESILTNSI